MSEGNAHWPGSIDLLEVLDRLPAPALLVELVQDDLRMLWANSAVGEVLGIPARNLTGTSFSSYPTLRELLHEMLPNLRQALSSGKPVSFEQEIRVESGIANYATSVIALDGRRFFLMAEDITRRTMLEHLLRAGEAKYRAVFSGAREGIGLFNIDTFRCIEANDAFIAMYGWQRGELREVSLQQLGSSFDDEVFAREIAEKGTIHLGSGTSKRKDGSTFPSECDAHLIQLGERRVVCLISHDLSAQRQLQEKMLLADRFAAVGTLVAGVAHEVNNPLAYLLANLTFLAERLPELGAAGVGLNAAIEEMQPALREAITGAQRVKEIVNDLKTFSRPELPGGLPVSLAPLLDSVLRILQNELGQRATLVREVAPLPLVVGHEPRLAQVFLHLLNNALEALPDRPAGENQIRLTAKTKGREVVVEVEDNGVGIPEEQQRRVFDPFFTTRPIGGGTGLGLAVCHGIITGLGGRIELFSKAGKGTTVRVSLPVANIGKARPASDPNVLAMPAVPRLLVIDDEPMLTDAIRRMMMGEADVSACLSVEEAQKLLARGDQFDAILCDLHLTGINGMEFHAELSQSKPLLAKRMGFVTGGALEEKGQEFIRKHADRVLDKPFSRNALRGLVKSLMGQP